MPRELWNEGRVVGYSAYEMYVRHHLSVMPDTPPASEKEWLASMMAMGSSMLLRVNAEDAGAVGSHYIEVEFPEKCRLCAANNIIASFFSGAGYVEGNSTGWATKVIDYGPLICNESTFNSPHNNGNIPPMFTNIEGLSADTISQIREYMKIVDGIVIQPGTWTTNLNNPPYKDFKPTLKYDELKPELSKVPKLRILLSDRVEKDFFILLTGFTNRTVVDGQTGFDSAVNTQSPADGDFLGPWAFPWAAKVFFSVPSSFVNYFMSNKYSRKLPESDEEITVTSDSIIDMKSGNPKAFYSSKFNESKQDIVVTDINTIGEDAAVLVTFSKTDNLPPALYGSLINQKDSAEIDNILYPIDTVAPGTVKLYQEDGSFFSDVNVLQTYITDIESSVPFNYGLYRELSSAVIMQRDPIINEFVPVSNDKTINLAGVCTYNTEYAWFYVMGDGGNAPSHNQLSSVDSFIIAEGWKGYLSQEFIDKYCIPLNDLINNIDNYKDSDGMELISGFYASIPESEMEKYGVVITSSYSDVFTEPSQQYSGLLVRLNDGAVSQITFRNSSLPFGLNFNYRYTEQSGYWPMTTQYLGTWWSNSASAKDAEDEVIFTGHNTTYTAIPDYNSFYQNASVATPAQGGSGAKYGDDFRAWFKYTPMSTLLSDLGMTWNDCIWKDGDMAKKVHDDYKDLSILTFLMKAMTKNDLSKPDNSDNAKINLGTRTMYLFPKSELRNEKPWTSDMSATGKVEWSNTGTSFYQPSLWKFSERSENDWVDKTDEFVRPDSTIWASIGISGHNQTTSISLVDEYGAQLPTQGTGGIVDCDYLTWGDLLSSLNQNRKIDILGEVLRNLKIHIEESGYNYIKFKNSPRLYISSTEPEGDIPNGSIGIGW